MKITISGSLGNIGTHLTKKLVAAGHEVTVITSTHERVQQIEKSGAKAGVGSVDDADFLKDVFNGAEAIFAMTPPNLGGSNVVVNTVNAGKAFAKAIKETGINRVVMLSSIGADLPGNGPIEALHGIEKLYRALEDVSVTFLRAGSFYINFYHDIPLIKGRNIMGGNYPVSTTFPLVHPEDIATAAAEELEKASSGKYVRYIVSDVSTPGQIAKTLGAAIGKPDLPWVEFTDEQAIKGMTGAGLPEEVANLYTEMGAGFRSGKIQADFIKNGSPVDGQIKLEKFAKEFAEKF